MKTLHSVAGTLFVLASFVPHANAQLLLSEDFNYPPGDSLRGHGWLLSGSTLTNPLMVSAPGLTFAGHPGSGEGNAVTLSTSGQDCYRLFTASTGGTVYLWCMVNVVSAQAAGDYCIAMSPSSPQTNYTARTFVKSSGTGFLFGLAKGSETPRYGSTVWNLGETYLCLVKYAFNTPDTADATLSLFVFSAGNIPVDEPSDAEVGPYSSPAREDAVNLGSITLRQGSSTASASVIIDGLRIMKAWESALPITLGSISAVDSPEEGVRLRWVTYSETQNFGFEVQRTSERLHNFESISRLIPGSGTTIEPHSYGFVDTSATAGIWLYRLKQIDLDMAIHYSEPVRVAVASVRGELARQSLHLSPNYPNPFNPATRIPFGVSSAGRVTLDLLTITGQRLVTLFDREVLPGVQYTAFFDGSPFPSGVYLYRLEGNGRSVTRKMILAK